jgi:HK97 family phage major capsid protein
MPLNQAQGIIELNVLTSPIRPLATVETISAGDALELPKEGSTTFSNSWVGETGSRAETTAGTFALDRIPVHEMYSNPYVTQKMIDDPAFGIEAWVSRKVAEQFGKTENTAFCTGDGMNKPEGIAATTNGVTAQVCTATGAFTAALLMDLQYLLEEPYASNATWISKRINFGKIRQLTGNEGFLWQPGITADKGPTLLGQPYVAANDVATIVSASAGDRVIYFGDIRAGYRIVDRMGITLLRDPYTSKPYIQFYSTKRVGGQVVLPEAIKIGTVNS